MLQHPGNLIGDAWFYVQDDIVHCFYLTCPQHVTRHTYWDIGHATSGDLVNWQRHDLALTRGPKGSWDDMLATGSILRWEGRFWMAYTGGRTAQVGLAVSDDLFHWKKCSDNPVTCVDERYYETQGSGVRKIRHWRDPYLFEYEGAVHHIVCASRRDGPCDSRGTVGLARTNNMRDWEILPPPELDRITQELECPQIYAAQGRYFLVFSTATEWFSREFLAQHTADQLGFSTYCMVGPTPLGPFRLSGTGRILPPAHGIQPYACQLVLLKDNAYLQGTLQSADGDAICDPIPVGFTAERVTITCGVE